MKRKVLPCFMALSMTLTAVPNVAMAEDGSRNEAGTVVETTTETGTTTGTEPAEEPTGEVGASEVVDTAEGTPVNNGVTEGTVVEATEIQPAMVMATGEVAAENGVVKSVGTAEELSNAVSEAQDGVETTIQLTDNIDFGTVTNESTKDNGIEVICVEIKENKNIILDLNGHALTASLDTDGNDYWLTQVICNRGTLTITDSSENHAGLISNTNEKTNACTRTVKNVGTMVIEGGTIRSEGAVALLNSAKCTIKGENTVLEATKVGYTGGWNNAVAAIENRNSGELIIENASVRSVSESAIYCDSTAASFIVYDGTFEGNENYGAFNGSAATKRGVVYGGKWSSDPTSILAEKHYVEKDENWYVVKEMTTTDVTVSTEELLATLDALSAADAVNISIAGDITMDTSAKLPKGSTIEILEESSLTIGENAVLTQDGTIVNNGTLTVDGFLTTPLNLQNNGVITNLPYEGNEFVIDSAMDLQWLSYFVEHDQQDWHVTMEADVTIPAGVSFQMIGAGENGFYNSVFDGKGHSISGLYIRNVSSQTGMFSSLMNTELKNFTVDLDVETVTAFTGGLVGYAVEGVSFENITVKGRVAVTGGSYGCAAFVGSAGNKSGENKEIIFVNCHNEATVGGANGYNIGSMIGTASGSDDDLSFYNCSNSGAIIAKGSVGYAMGYGDLASTAKINAINFEDKNADGKDFCGAVSPTIPATVSPDNYAVKDENGWTAIENDEEVIQNAVVAKIDGKEYTSLNAAIKDAKDGDVITLQKDIENSDYETTTNISINKNITLDGNGHTVKGNVAIYVDASNADTTITNIHFTNIHNSKNNLSPVYAHDLSGKLTITNCSFTNCDWDAIQITPVAGAEIVITDNTFEVTEDAVQGQRFVHVESGKNVDFRATVTRNKMLGNTQQSALEVYFPADLDKVMLSGNYITSDNKLCILDGNGNNVPEVAYPMADEDLKPVQDETVIVKTPPYTSKVYKTLEDALKEVKTGDEITLLQDISVSATLSIPQGVAFDVNGKRIALQAGAKLVVYTDISDSIDVPSGYKLVVSGNETDGFTYTAERKSSGGGSHRYDGYITIINPKNGTVSVSDDWADEDQKITLTITPDKGYAVDKIEIVDAEGDKIDAKKVEDKDDKYTFRMANCDVTVTVTFKEEGKTEDKEETEETDKTEETTTPETITFSDVKESDWFYKGVSYVVENGMMNGVGDNQFAPNAPLTREMLAVVLYNMEKQPESTGVNPFADVKADMWYTDAIVWANANGIVAGYDDSTFGLGDSITREQLAAILYRYAQLKGYDVTEKADLTGYTDSASISSYAVEAMQWANANGIVNGMTETTLAPQGTAIRAQVATMLMNFCENVAAKAE
ncbi:S-layer homology domain-containing protein [Anaerotignum lactatifermentans]